MSGTTSIFLISAAAAVIFLATGMVLLRHLARVESRLRAVKAAAPEKGQAGWFGPLERLLVRILPRAYQAALTTRLYRANLSERLTPQRVVGIAAAAGIALATLASLRLGLEAGLFLTPLLVVAGTLVAGVLLDRRAARRRQAVQRSLPSTLDLMVLAMEAGLNLDSALREVVAEWHSPATRELERVVALMQLGLSRTDALLEVAESLGLDSFGRMAGRMSTAARLGSSMVLILRSEAEDARRERRTTAQRKVAQAPTKILMPTALLILPVTMIVVMGPAIPEILRVVGG